MAKSRGKEIKPKKVKYEKNIEIHSEQLSNGNQRATEYKEYKRSMGLMGYGMTDFDHDDSLRTDKSDLIHGFFSEQSLENEIKTPIDCRSEEFADQGPGK